MAENGDASQEIRPTSAAMAAAGLPVASKKQLPFRNPEKELHKKINSAYILRWIPSSRPRSSANPLRRPIAE